MEFNSERDIQIAEKMLSFPFLGERIEGKWNFALTREFDMTNDSGLFKPKPGSRRLELYEGKMIHQFNHRFSEPRYWVDEKEGRMAVLGRQPDVCQKLEYQDYRLGLRAVASNTNTNSLICSAIPRNVFCGNSILSTQDHFVNRKNLLFCAAHLNSLTLDWLLRKKVSQNINMFYVYQHPVPRLPDADKDFTRIVDRAARLICTTLEFDDLAKEVGLRDHRDGVTDPTDRARLRPELDGMIAHLYGLTEEEFTHILSTFPLIVQSAKDAALNAYREFAPKPGDQEIAALISRGESATLEFKSSARWDMKQNKADKLIEGIVVKTVAALLNSEGGGLLLGVDDDRNVIGLAHDYKLSGKKDSRDAYEDFLTGLLLNNLGKDSATLIAITFHELDGKDVCRVEAKKSPKPVFVKDNNGEHLYIRAGNSTRQPTTKEAIDYCKMHWP